MLTTLLSQIGLPAIFSIVSGLLEKLDDPVAKGASEALQKVDTAIRNGKITDRQMQSLNNHTKKMAELKLQEYEVNLSEINKTIRTEIASQDKYVRRMRPTFGYIVALSWAAQMFGIAYIIIFDTARAGIILTAMSHLSTIWGIGLSVLGIYVYKRSEDKQHLHKDAVIWAD